jgi:hypothetical protein
MFNFVHVSQNLRALDFSRLLLEVMTVADEVDSQLTQAMESYLGRRGEASGSVAVNYHGRSRTGRSDHPSRQIWGRAMRRQTAIPPSLPFFAI